MIKFNYLKSLLKYINYNKFTENSTIVRNRQNILLNNSLNKNHYQFSSQRRKGLEENFRLKENKNNKTNNNQKQNQSRTQNSKLQKSNSTNDINANTNSYINVNDLIEITNMKFLKMQLFPISLLLTPSIFYLQNIQDPYFLMGCQMAQLYACIALWMNLDFKNYHQQKTLEKHKIIFAICVTASLHTLSGYYSILTPVGMALLTILVPFKFSPSKQKYTQIQLRRMNNITHIRISYILIFIMLGILKAMHYQKIYGFQKKLGEFDEKNKEQTFKLTEKQLSNRIN